MGLFAFLILREGRGIKTSGLVHRSASLFGQSLDCWTATSAAPAHIRRVATLLDSMLDPTLDSTREASQMNAASPLRTCFAVLLCHYSIEADRCFIEARITSLLRIPC
jgi:hypothetical protein